MSKGDTSTNSSKKVQRIHIKGTFKQMYSPYENRIFLMYRITEIIPLPGSALLAKESD